MIVCPRCEAQNPEGARFCLQCGSPLAQVAAGEERKLITVLFCDLVGFTERSDRADPEDVKATLRVYHTLLKRVIDRYGGTVDKFIGDAVLGVFGAPVGHEDDPERAVHAALRILDDVAEANREHPGLELAVRIGVNTGEAVVAFGQGPQIGESVTGDVVNTASRIQSLAPTGGILVGETTYHATSTIFEYEELPPASVKGKAEPLAIWRPIEARARTGVDWSQRPPTTFVGRTDEATTMRQVWRKTAQLREARGGAVQLLTVIGEPGVGKTRLIREFSAYLDELPDLIRWRQGRCLPYGDGVGFWAFGEMVKAQAGILDSDSAEEAEAKLGTELDRFVDDPAERDWMRACLTTLLGSSDGTGIPREELFAAWRRFVEALAEDNPLVLLFEDLHWADRPMLELIEHLVAESEMPFLVLCAARPELYERAPAWGEDGPNAITIALPPLSDAETALLLSSLLERAVLPAETQATLIERSGGNPLYAEEFVQLLVDRGMIDREHPERLLVASGDVPIPDSLQSLIGSRLDGLPWADKALLQDAAVIGKVFWSSALATLNDVDESEVGGRLEDAIRRELVRQDRLSTLKDQAQYSFWHALVRDVAYGQIPRAARERKHVAAARWLRGAIAERASDFAEELAYHYLEALDLAEAAGEEVDPEVRAEAGAAALLAGERTAPLEAPRAERYFRRALGLMSADHPDRPRAAARAAEIAEARGNFAESEQLFLAAMTGYRVTGDMRGLGEAMGILARAYSRRGETQRSETLMDEAIELLEAEPPSRELARVYTRRAGELLGADDYELCLSYAVKGLELAEQLGLRDEIIRGLQFRGAARCELGDDERGLADLREAIRLGLEAGLGQSVALAYGNYAYQLWFREGPVAALEVWRQMQRVAEARGFDTQAQQARMGQLETLFDIGEWDEVLAICDEMAAWTLPEDRRTEIAVYGRTFEAWVRLRRGDVVALAPFAEELLESAIRFPQSEYASPALLVTAETRRAAGDLAGAREAIDRFAEHTASAPNYRALFAPVAVRSLIALGDVDAAEAMIPDQGLTWTPRHLVSVMTARTLVAEARGSFEEAATGYREVVERWRALGFRLELGLTLTGLGRCLLELGQDHEAVSVLREARQVLEPLRATPSLADVDELLGEPAVETG
ncbi:MAG TPA: adenylate/guanylate cyclase domain-containing protein [Actinomycetota bacterium]